MTTNEIHKELDLIQGVIGRMAQNSFQVKAWLMGVLGVMLAFTKDEIIATTDHLDSALMLNAFLFLPILCFWYLDAFFLSTERLYRELYKWVIRNRSITNDYLYDLNTFVRTIDGERVDLKSKKNSLVSVMFSKTLIPFYIIPLFLVILLMAYNIWSTWVSGAIPHFMAFVNLFQRSIFSYLESN